MYIRILGIHALVVSLFRFSLLILMLVLIGVFWCCLHAYFGWLVMEAGF